MIKKSESRHACNVGKKNKWKFNLNENSHRWFMISEQRLVNVIIRRWWWRWTVTRNCYDLPFLALTDSHFEPQWTNFWGFRMKALLKSEIHHKKRWEDKLTKKMRHLRTHVSLSMSDFHRDFKIRCQVLLGGASTASLERIESSRSLPETLPLKVRKVTNKILFTPNIYDSRSAKMFGSAQRCKSFLGSVPDFTSSTSES